MEVLKGVRVIELGSYITAPYAAMLLAELGADVVKVERPNAPDPFRGPEPPNETPHFFAFNRNKRSLALDYDVDAEKQLLLKVIESADVVIINVRPGVERKIGLDFETLRKTNPRLIYCAITGFGATGPYSDRPAYDNVGQVLSGLLSRFHDASDPRVAGPALSDTLTGLFAAFGIVGALYERAQSGSGRLVEVNMLEASLAVQVEPISHFLIYGTDQPFYHRGAASQAYILECRDGKRIGIHMSVPDKFWVALADATGRRDILQEYPTRAERMDNYSEIGEELKQLFLTRDREDWAELLLAHDVPFACERASSELQSDPQIQHLGTFGEAQDPNSGRYIGLNRPVRYDGDNRSIKLMAPLLGLHTEEILAELGLSRGERAGEVIEFPRRSKS
jgi:crotonobetainyl-CoA:carnitine CoA-transferase CaiB-like acyl-CoA transferase